ncbi:MAG: sugar kinase [Clostridia bacterium]|nr:sugar kinase [Clostridia bacterium]MBQ4157498.1 sugar kinase [Clostridia bacterium]
MFDINTIDNISVGVLGDLALDIYWYADMKKSELSRETPHFPLPVVRERMSPGAGGNVAVNAARLTPGKLFVSGVIGDDWRGDILKKQLRRLGCDMTGVIEEKNRFTCTYAKPIRMGISNVMYEDPRLDFSPDIPIAKETEDALVSWLKDVDGKIDILLVCDQFDFGVVTDRVLARLAAMKTPIIADSRKRIADFKINGVLKPNEDELRNALLGMNLSLPEDLSDRAMLLSKKTGAKVLMTIGEKGSIFASFADLERFHTPAFPVKGEIDICGAGDASLAAFACALAAGAGEREAARLAAAASAVAVKKIGETGSASREEILAVMNAVA